MRLGIDVVVTDVDEEAAGELAASASCTAVTREHAPSCELVVVATPTAGHVADLRWALLRGADVFVEKPLATSRTELESARSLMREFAGRVVMIGCNLRFSEGFAALSANLSTVGRPAVFLVDYGWWLPAWRPATDYRTQYSALRALGGGIVLDAVHEIDYTLTLAGEAEEIRGMCTTSGVLEVDVEDTADITLRHKGGAMSHIHVDYLRRRYSRSCTVIGTDAQLTWDVPRSVVEVVTSPGAEPRRLAQSIDSDPNAQYLAEMEHMLTAIETRSPTCNDIDRAATTVEVALLARGGDAG